MPAGAAAKAELCPSALTNGRAAIFEKQVTLLR